MSDLQAQARAIAEETVRSLWNVPHGVSQSYHVQHLTAAILNFGETVRLIQAAELGDVEGERDADLRRADGWEAEAKNYCANSDYMAMAASEQRSADYERGYGDGHREYAADRDSWRRVSERLEGERLDAARQREAALDLLEDVLSNTAGRVNYWNSRAETLLRECGRLKP